MRAEVAQKPQNAQHKATPPDSKSARQSSPLLGLAKIFSSLRLTVVCLCLAVLLVFVGTLAQRDEGNFAVQKRFFQSFFVVWSPAAPWKIPLPGGYLIGGVLLVNLLAAHATRFKLSWRKSGIFIIHAGIILMIVGQFATDMLSTESALQIFEGETKSYSEDFHADELVLVDASDPNKDHVISVPASLLSRKGDIRDPALPVTLRVHRYWRNCDVQDRAPAQAINPGADRGIFTNTLLLPLPESANGSQQTRAAALVEILSDKESLGTFLVPARAEEPQSFHFQNRDWSIAFLFAPRMGGNQLVISAGEQQPGGGTMVAFPESEVAQKGELTREGLPLKLRVKEFWPNCRLFAKPGPNTVIPEVTQGALTDVQVTERPPVADSDHRNFPGATVEVLNNNSSLGTFFLYSGVNAQQQFLAGGKPWQIALRVKRHYYPFSVTLLKATHETYRGRADIPKNFASLVRVDNPKESQALETKISMNNPLRYAGLTFFQYQMTAGDMAQKQGLRPSTVLQVVHNPGWTTPYISCVLVVFGLLVQFMIHLIGFVIKHTSE